MQLAKRQTDFLNSEVGLESKRQLELMVQDDRFNTEPSYSANTTLYPDNLIPFIDKHMSYLCSHTQTDPTLYLSNLRLITRMRNMHAR